MRTSTAVIKPAREHLLACDHARERVADLDRKALASPEQPDGRGRGLMHCR